MSEQEMNNETVIQIDNISVNYRLPTERIGSFKEYAIRKLQRRVRIQDFWALVDVSMTVNKCDFFGII